MAVIINNKKQSRSSARQMARAVQGREGLEAIHVIAHGRPCEVVVRGRGADAGYDS